MNINIIWILAFYRTKNWCNRYQFKNGEGFAEGGLAAAGGEDDPLTKLDTVKPSSRCPINK